MARGKKDSPAAGRSGDPVVEEEATAAAAMEVEEQEEVEEGDKGDEEGEWKEEDDEEEEEEWVQDDEEEEEEADEARLEPPKLAEGFYEIETIRRRRLRKGQMQYLVKWRGWPESANTWEPAENLKACSDFVDAFEKRQQPRAYGKRKRKRKSSITPVTSPNPSHGTSGTGRGRGRPRRSNPRSPSNLPPPERKMLPLRTSSRRATDNSNKNLAVGLDASVNVVSQQMLGQSATQEGSSDVLSVGFPCKRTDVSVVVQQQDEHQRVNGLSKVENSVQAPPPAAAAVPAPAPPSHAVQVTGAKKRKLGYVRRFRHDEVQQEQGEVQNGRSEKQTGNEDVDSTQGETGDRTKGSDSANRLHITKIIKPVRYFATMTDHVQQVSITFKALRSDGQEVLVDDKELKSNNPLVLINYYEQHLRYNPTS